MNLSDISIKRPVFPMILALAMMFFGYIALISMPLELMPEIDMPYVTIQTIYPGADAETIEREVTERIENAISIVSGINLMISASQDNFTYTVVELEVGENVDIKIQEFRDKISAIMINLPSDIEDPVVEKIDITAMPIVSLVISGPGSTAQTTKYVENIVKDRIQQISGVGTVTRVGGREREIRLWLDPLKMNSKKITATEIIQIIASKNVDIPGGVIEQDLVEYNIKTKGQLEKVDDFRNLILTYMNGAPVYVKDIAEVRDGFEDERSLSRLNGSNAIALQVIAQPGSNIVKMVEEVEEITKELMAEDKIGYSFKITQDMSLYVKQTVDGAKEDIIIGICFTVLVIMIFLGNGRMTIVTSLAIPTSMLAAIATIHFMGYSLNMLTMLGMALSVGIVVDDTIVMVENIYRHMEMGKSRVQASIEGAKQITFAILAATFSLLAVFLPFATMGGMAGEFFRPFGWTVAITIFWSLIISLTLATMLSSRLVVFSKKSSLLKRSVDRFMNALEQGYKGTLAFALRARFLILFIAIAFFAFAAVIVATQIKTEFEPSADRSEFFISVEAPLGTALHKTSQVMKEMEQSISLIPEVKLVFASIGGGQSGQVYKGDIYIQLTGMYEREKDQFALMAETRKIIQKIADKENFIISLTNEASQGGMGGKPLQYSIKGGEYDEISKYTNKLIDELSKNPSITDIDQTYKPFKPELNIKINREKAAQLGVPIISIASTIRTFIAGTDVTTFKEGGDEYDVVAMMSKKYRNNIKSLNDLTVRSQTGQLVNLSNLIMLDQSVGSSEINRRARQREILVSANLNGIVLGEGKEIISNIMKNIKLPSGYSSSFEGMSEIVKDVFSSLFTAMGLGFLVVYIVLAIQFNSFIHPITIMLSIPFAFGGGWLFLFFFDKTMNMFSMVGMVLLIGIVIKNGILLIDFIIKFRSEGLSRKDAILRAGPLRLRPILMTAFSTIAGMIPLALELSEGSEWRSPMAFVIIGGMLTSTLLTLLVIPVVYTMFDDVANNRLFKWILSVFVPSENANNIFSNNAMKQPVQDYSVPKYEQNHIETTIHQVKKSDKNEDYENEMIGTQTSSFEEFQKMNDELSSALDATRQNNENYVLLKQLESEISEKLSNMKSESSKIEANSSTVLETDSFPEMRSEEDSRRFNAVTLAELEKNRLEMQKQSEIMNSNEENVDADFPDFDENDILKQFDLMQKKESDNKRNVTENQPDKETKVEDIKADVGISNINDVKFYDPVTSSSKKDKNEKLFKLDNAAKPNIMPDTEIDIKAEKPVEKVKPKPVIKPNQTANDVPNFTKKSSQSVIYPPPTEQNDKSKRNDGSADSDSKN